MKGRDIMELGFVLSTAFNAVVPILLLILLGYILRRMGFLNDNFLSIGKKLVFNVCLPVMLFVNIYDTEGFSSIKWDVVLYVLAIIVLFFIISFAVAVSATKIPERRGVLMQCFYRSNFAIIGLPLASALGGSEAMSMAAVLSAFSIPVFNIFAVISLTVFLDDSKGGKIDLKGILLNIAKNPLIIGVVSGLVCLGLRQLQTEIWGRVVLSLSRDLKFLYKTLEHLKSVTSPFALIVLGGQFEFSAVKGMFKEIAVGTVCRLIFAPLLGIGMAVLLSAKTPWFSCGVNEYPGMIALFGSPVAVSSAVMAGAMNNDEQLATQLVVWTSIGSILTIFLTVCIMLPAGLLAP